jgi:pantoate--beta-alanine ligase
VIVPQTLDEAERLVAGGLTDPVELEAKLTAFLGREPLAKPEVVAVRDASTLQKVTSIADPVVVALFVRVGSTRLLDNRVVSHNQVIGDKRVISGRGLPGKGVTR